MFNNLNFNFVFDTQLEQFLVYWWVYPLSPHCHRKQGYMNISELRKKGHNPGTLWLGSQNQLGSRSCVASYI